MKQFYRSAFFVLFALFLAIACCIPSSYAGLNCVPLSGQAPVINGTMSPGEWSGAPQLTIASPILTNVYCKNDAQNLYILVNALGDTTDDNSVSPCLDDPNDSRCDECLLVFGEQGQPTVHLAEVWGKAGDIKGTNTHLPAGTEVAIGFSGNRFYEWKIPLASINAVPGQTLDFSSPKACKWAGSGEFCAIEASIPFDGATLNDNEWPAGVNVSNRSTWDTITLAQRVLGIPALSDWGIISFMIFAGIGAAFVLRKRKCAR